MVKRVSAIFENGIFRPLEPISDLTDQAMVQLQVEVPSDKPVRLSDFAGIWTDEEADEIEAIIEAECEQVDPREW